MQEETTNEAAAPPLAPASELARPVAEALASGLTGHARSLVQALEAPDQADLIELLADLSQVMADASICGLGQAAPNPVKCVFKYFPEDLR